MQKLVVILGPTASGKSSLAVKLAKHYNGEIVSADSRQVYKGLNIGSGKITKKEMQGVPHYLLDVASPKTKFSVSIYQKLAYKAIKKIQAKGRVPFLVGGSPLYIYSAIEGWAVPNVKPNDALRKKFEKLSTEDLFQKLQKLDPRRAATIEQKNRRRLIRALEIVITTKKPVPELQKSPLPYPVLFLGIKKSKEGLKILIHNRLLVRFGKNMLNSPMVKEVQNLHKNGLSWKQLEEFGLEYRFIAQYLQKKLLYEEMMQQLEKAIIDFSRRQTTWFSAHSPMLTPIHWITSLAEAKNAIKNFL